MKKILIAVFFFITVVTINTQTIDTVQVQMEIGAYVQTYKQLFEKKVKELEENDKDLVSIRAIISYLNMKLEEVRKSK